MTEPRTPGDAVAQAALPPVKTGRANTKAETAARRAKAVSLALAGMSFEQIATECGYGSRKVAQNAVRTSLSQVQVDNVTELRQHQVAQLDRLLLGVWTNAIKGSPGHVREARKLLDSKARLLGLNAPLQVEDVTGVDQAITALRLRLSADLEALPAAADGTFTVTDVDGLGDDGLDRPAAAAS